MKKTPHPYSVYLELHSGGRFSARQILPDTDMSSMPKWPNHVDFILHANHPHGETQIERIRIDDDAWMNFRESSNPKQFLDACSDGLVHAVNSQMQTIELHRCGVVPFTDIVLFGAIEKRQEIIRERA